MAMTPKTKKIVFWSAGFIVVGSLASWGYVSYKKAENARKASASTNTGGKVNMSVIAASKAKNIQRAPQVAIRSAIPTM